MSADLLDNRVIEMARVTQEVTGDIVCVFDAVEDVVGQGKLGTLPQLVPDVLALKVDVLHPAVVRAGRVGGDVFLEDDNVGIWNGLGVGGGEERSDALVDGAGREGGSGGGEQRQ